MVEVGARELKNRLGHYLGIVRRGGRILVTERGKPVAEIRPAGEFANQQCDALEALLADLASRGEVTLPAGKGFRRVKPLRRDGLTLSDVVASERR